MNGGSVVWTWHDEYKVMLALPASSFDRYVLSGLTRTRDFLGQPTTSEWATRFLTLAQQAKEHRRVAA